MAPENKMKPCPFCGGEAEYFEERIFVSPLRNVSWKGVKCKRCGGSYIDANPNTCPNDMIKAWNRRVDNGSKTN